MRWPDNPHSDVKSAPLFLHADDSLGIGFPRFGKHECKVALEKEEIPLVEG